MLCIKANRKQVWGKHTAATKQDTITKIMKFRKQWTKNRALQSWTEMGLRAGHPASYMGRPTHHSTASPCASSTVRYEPNTLCFYMFRFLFQT